MHRLKFRGTRLSAAALAVATLALAAPPAAAQDLSSFKQKTTLHRLDNGWTFVISERPVAPVFSFATYVDVGSVQEVPGITGLAHMFEHMAFKGTPEIGTRDHKNEKKAIEELEAAYQAMQEEKLQRHPDAEKVGRLEARFKELQEKAAAFVVPNEFTDIITREGGTGLNASTSYDYTNYFYSLPSNKFELMAYLESERFLRPVFREFYKERDVVQEERRLRTESQPFGRLLEQFMATAFVAHPYKQPIVGYMSDLKTFTLSDAEEFYEKYYVPANFVTAIVGNVKAKEIIPVLEAYFGRIPAGPRPQDLRTTEPRQQAEKVVRLQDPSQPIYAEGYHKPSALDADAPVYEAIDNILSRGRTSRMYRALVEDKKIAVAAQSFSSFPGEKYPGLWIAFAVPAKGHSNEEVADAIHMEIDRLKTEPVTDEELDRFRTQTRANLVRSLRSNTGLARNLAEYQLLYGDWQELFRSVDRLQRVTKDDIQRVARSTFVASNRTVGMIVTETPEADGAAGAAAGR